MTSESEFIAALRCLALHPGARGLLDDTAVLEIGGASLVIAHDMIVEGVHFLAGDSPADVAWKLVAVNLSDLAAKGARPIGVLLGYGLSNAEWDLAFVEGLGAALAAFEVALLGGDTVAPPAGTPRTLGLTVLGEAGGQVPPRAGAEAGDDLWVTGTIGDAGAGLRLLTGDPEAVGELVERYRRPAPRLAAGRALAPLVRAMMDVSDGLLIDASRIAAASGVRVEIDLSLIPLSPACVNALGEGRTARLAAATSGDDYELLFSFASGQADALVALAETLDLPFTRVGRFVPGSGIALNDGGEDFPLPSRLGYEHGRQHSTAAVESFGDAP